MLSTALRKDAQGNPWLGIGYHFVIGNGRGMEDGQVEPTFRWKQQLAGAHAGQRRHNESGIGICLIGNFDEAPPTAKQLSALKELLAGAQHTIRNRPPASRATCGLQHHTMPGQPVSVSPGRGRGLREDCEFRVAPIWSIHHPQPTAANHAMNRIQQLDLQWNPDVPCFGDGADEPTDAPTIEAGKFSHGASEGHTLFAPLHYERNYAYPLIVWLHGPRDDERQLRRIMPLVSLRNYVAVAPRGTASAVEGSDSNGYTWSQTPAHMALAEQRVLDAVAAARDKFNVAPSRIFLAGFAAGGTMALRVALAQPRLFAGVLSLGGALPTGHTPLAQLSAIRRLQVFLATGRDSQQYAEQLVCENLRLLYTAGMKVNLRQYPCGDELTENMLADMDRWIMDQLSATTAVASNQTSW